MGKQNEQVLFQGAVYSKDLIESFKFPVGCKFRYNNASYNDTFTVTGVRKDPGAEYRQITGNIAGEVWMLLSSLQKEAASGTVTMLSETLAMAKKEKAPKKTVKKKKKATKKK